MESKSIFTAIPGRESYRKSVREALAGGASGKALSHAFVFDSVSSTMDAAQLFVTKGAEALPAESAVLNDASSRGHAMFLSAAQLQGRGRKSRPWHSAPMEGMYLTYLLERKLKDPSWPSITLVMGLAVLETAVNFGGEYRLKWPNDVLAWSPEAEAWRKISGVLTEALGPDNRFLSIGIGLNVSQSRFPPEVPGISLTQASSSSIDYFAVLRLLTERVLDLYEEFSRSGFTAFQERWWNSSLMPGATAHVEQLGGTPCPVLALAPDGGLVVETPKGPSTIYAGDIILF